MKLLPVVELNSKINEQKKSDIDAGLFLAKKIDRLREELADAQKERDDGFEAIRLDTVAFMNEQSGIRATVTREIEELTEERRLLRIPLDAEWQKIRDESEKNSELSLQLIGKEFELKKQEQSNSETSKTLEKREKAVQESETETEENLEISRQNRKESDRILEEAKQYEIKTKESVEIRTKAVKQREINVTYREVDAENKWDNALTKEQENDRETKRIESKQRQLQAAFAELKKKNG